LNLLVAGVNQRRAVLLSPTASGKSFLIYTLMRYFNKKTLIIVPTINLVNQMYKDFAEYGYDVKSNCHRIYHGVASASTRSVPVGSDSVQALRERAMVTISTWQSIHEEPEEYFSEYECVIGDECHGFKAKCLTSIMTKLTNCPYRFGLSGTLDDTQVHELVLEGLFGPIIEGKKTKELIDEGYLADLNIVSLILEYPEEERKFLRGATFQEETDYIVAHEGRRDYLKKLAISMKGSTFILFRLVDKHGKQIYTDLQNAKGDKSAFVYGGTDGDEREDVRLNANMDSGLSVVASYGVFSTGTNVPNLRNVIFASPYKSKIKVLQSIGRGLRRTKTKTNCTIYDLVDDFSIGDDINYSVKHYLERNKIYNKEGFDYKHFRIPITKRAQSSKEDNAKEEELRQQQRSDGSDS
jgi:superfamily II DNA or RNA helicase